MKKLLMIAAVAFAFTACTDEKKTETTVVTDTSSNALMNDAMLTDSIAAVQNVTAMGNGDIMMKDGKILIMKAGSWVEMKETTTTANGAKVMTNGTVITKEGNKIQLTEGGMIHNNGTVMDNSGKTIGQKVDAALDTGGAMFKEGAKDLKEETGRLIKKAGEGLKKAGDKMQAKP